ncbi:MAG: hypothetical protein WDO06_07790 [Actinomycetota bacterium]
MISSLSSAPVKGLKKIAGHGSQVIKFAKPISGFKKILITHNGESNFYVRPMNSRGVATYSLINEIGIYKGTTILPAGTQYLAFEADGDWTYSVS